MLFTLLRWRRQCAFDGPPVPVYSLPNRPRRKPGDFRPFSGGHCSAVVSEKSASVAVSGLFLAGSPAAILWRVWSVVIHSLKTVVAAWSVAHIGAKCPKGFSPPLAHCDSAPAISWICGITWIAAPLNHKPPCSVQVSSSKPVSGVFSGDRLKPDTATASRFFAKVTGQHNGGSAARAFAKPVTLAVAPLNANGCQSPKNLSSQIHCDCHKDS